MIGVLALMLAAAGEGAVAPKPGALDPRIQTVVYDRDQVVSLNVTLGYQLTVEFPADERIETVAVGNAAAWQVTADKAADRLFIKPMQSGIETNLSVVTGSRSYTFELRGSGAGSPAAAYLVRILEPQVVAAVAETPAPATYTFTGDRSLRPVAVSDDGHATSFTFAEATPLPAIYAVPSGGQETLVNGAVRSGALVVDAIAPEFVLRRGGKFARLTRRIQKPRRP